MDRKIDNLSDIDGNSDVATIEAPDREGTNFDKTDIGSVSEGAGKSDGVYKDKPNLTPVRKELRVPDIGGSESVEVIEVSIAVGSNIAEEDTLITLESDKASMDIPSPQKGRVVEVTVREGDALSEGDLIGYLETVEEGASYRSTEIDGESDEKLSHELPEAGKSSHGENPGNDIPVVSGATENRDQPKFSKIGNGRLSSTCDDVHAGPSVRRMARELGVKLSEVPPGGPRRRILKEDVNSFVRNLMIARQDRYGNPVSAGKDGGRSSGIPSVPEVDFSQFGQIEEKPMSGVMKAGATNLHRSWLNVPHVTQFDEADITDLEAYRESLKGEFREQDIRLTLLPFIVKAVADALQNFPRFNVSLVGDGESVAWKKYFNIGVAVDSPGGLLVPVIRGVDQKSITTLSGELNDVAEKARKGRLDVADMRGGCITISSLGGVGGTAFTPIVNAPEVAILGVSRSEIKPVYNGKEFIPRLKLPLSLSYDHRAVNGADAARFVNHIGKVVADIRHLLL